MSFFKSCFVDRAQCVQVGGLYSPVLNVSTGVPQGSMLGPLLFNIYVNDMTCLSLNSQLFLYADDTALAITSETYEEASGRMQ